MLSEKDFYFCRSKLQRDYFKKQGIRYLFTLRDLKYDIPVWVFERTDNVVSILRDWQAIRNDLISEQE